ncbi:MAG: 50S ribosomal protein L18 [Nanobdellota archaeon]
MARKSIKAVEFRRKREGKTDYKQRLTYLKSQKQRLVIRLASNHIICQIVEFHPDGDLTKVFFNSKKLKDYGWNYSAKNIPAAYLTGLVVGKLAETKKITDVIADLGMQEKIHGCKLYAVIKGAAEAGLQVAHSEDCFPSENRLKGQHIQNHANTLGDDKEKQFSGYLKNKQNPDIMPEELEKTKQKILNPEK